jgi:hypothetical protein
MSGHENTVDNKPIQTDSLIQDNYQAIPQNLVSLGFIELPVPPPIAVIVAKNSPEVQRSAPKTTDYKLNNNTSSSYEKQTIEFRREKDTIIITGKTFDLKEIFKTLGVARWDKDAKNWTLSGMGTNIDNVMYTLDIIRVMQMKDMIKPGSVSTKK